MKFRQPIEFNEIIKLIRGNADKGVSYCIYPQLNNSDDLKLDTVCYIDDYPEITDDDEEIFSDFVVSNSLNLIFREELVQDVVLNALHQKSSVTDQEILEAVSYYSKNDSFMNLKP